MIMPPKRRGSGGGAILFFILLIAFTTSQRRCQQPASRQARQSSRVSTPVRNPIQDVLRPNEAAQYRDGVAAVILIDTSGSMKQAVMDTDGTTRPKIEIARRSAQELVN